MGISLGWVALLLAGTAGAPPADKPAAPIFYTVKMVEAEGVGWRSSVMSQLKPVAHQGAATVWTLPRNASKAVIQQISKSPAGAVVQGPHVIALAGMPATIQFRQTRKFVTQVAWNGEETAQKTAPEDVRVGWHTTMVGRKLDQGILVKIVFEDTEIRAVHQVMLDGPSDARAMKSGLSNTGKLGGQEIGTTTAAFTFEGSPFETPSDCKTAEANPSCGKQASEAAYVAGEANKTELMKDLMDKATTAYAAGKYDECEAFAKRAMKVDPNELAASMLVYKAKAERRFKADKKTFDAKQKEILAAIQEVDAASIVDPYLGCSEAGHLPTFAQTTANNSRCETPHIELPEVATQEVLGEWLIPNSECLLVSFGPHTVADKNGKAVVHERLAFIEADEQAGPVTAQRAIEVAPLHVTSVPSVVIAPAAPFGVTAQRAITVAPLHFTPIPPVVISPVAPFELVPPPPAPGAFVPYLPNGIAVYGIQPAPAQIGPPAIFIPAPVPPPVDLAPSARYMPDDVPGLSRPIEPPRTRTRAARPAPAPATGDEPPPAAGGARLPMPAAPSRSFPEGVHVDGRKADLPPLPADEMEDDSADSESAEPRPSPQTKKPRQAKPATDESTTKAGFTRPRSPRVFLPSLFMPSASAGFQFLLPISPLSIKLPFNKRLEIEIYGRVVPDTQVPATAN